MSVRLRGAGLAGGAVALALVLGLLLPAGGEARPGKTLSLSTNIEKVFGKFTRLDRLLTRAIDPAEKGESVESLINQIRAGKFAIVDQEMAAPIDGVPGSTWFRDLDAVDRELELAAAVQSGNLRVGHFGSRQDAITGFLKLAKEVKQ